MYAFRFIPSRRLFMILSTPASRNRHVPLMSSFGGIASALKTSIFALAMLGDGDV